MRELDAEAKQALLAPFQAAEVRVRSQPFCAAYVTSRVVQTRLDEVLPFQWSFILKGAGVTDAHGTMHQDGTLTIYGPDPLMAREYEDRGSAPPDVAKGQAKQAKHAVSDCFKRCAVQVGIGRYLYELTGVQAGRIGKAGLERALAAVGYTGPWDERHHGVIGGIREADEEDEAQGAPDPAPAAAASSPAPEGERNLLDLAGGDPVKLAAMIQSGETKLFGNTGTYEVDRVENRVRAGFPPKLDAYTVEQLQGYLAALKRQWDERKGQR